jgi:hypothetical protein
VVIPGCPGGGDVTIGTTPFSALCAGEAVCAKSGQTAKESRLAKSIGFMIFLFLWDKWRK